MFRLSLCRLGIVAAVTTMALVPPARAQTNIDQGKSAAEMFSSDCAVCHKSVRGLADGQNSLTLSSFLREHYTTGKDQASALAAYVMASGGGGPAPPGGTLKPSADRARATVEEPKNAESKAGDAKSKEPKTATAANHAPAKHEETPVTAKLERPNEDSAKPEDEPGAGTAASSRTAKREAVPAAAAPIPKPLPAVAAIPAEPAASPGAPDLDLNPKPSTTAAGEVPPSDSATTVPRDNIPD